jgi:hypothetical protein
VSPSASPSAVATDYIHIFSENIVEPNHATDNLSSVLIADDLEVQGESFFGTSSNYTKYSAGSRSQFGTARIAWRKITANGVTLGDGPPTSADSVTDLQTAHDGNIYTVSEIAGNAGQNLIVDFTGVTAFNRVELLARTEEQATHSLTVQLEVTPFDDSTWHTWNTMKDMASNQNMENYGFDVADDSAYINSGVVKVRFVHEMNGNANDRWVFDVVALYQ